MYRKLKQDTVSFAQDLVALTTKIGTNADLASAYVVGRFKDGTPVIDSDHPIRCASGRQYLSVRIRYRSDKMPLSRSHRKANPRGDTVRSNGAPIDVERNHRIVRRAFTYKDQGGETGLQFFYYQSDIGSQFEFIQSSWAN